MRSRATGRSDPWARLVGGAVLSGASPSCGSVGGIKRRVRRPHRPSRPTSRLLSVHIMPALGCQVRRVPDCGGVSSVNHGRLLAGQDAGFVGHPRPGGGRRRIRRLSSRARLDTLVASTMDRISPALFSMACRRVWSLVEHVKEMSSKEKKTRFGESDMLPRK